MIIEKQDGQERAKYGDGLIKELSIKMTKDFGKGFDVTNLKRMRQFYTLFRTPNGNPRLFNCRDESELHT